MNLAEGQKTGFYLDQRDNRKLLGSFSKNKKVLNTFCYTGGFSVYAIQAGAELVTSVDISQKAVDLATKNTELNFPKANHSAVASDVFEFLRNHNQQYDVIVLDPPAFAKSIKSKHTATQAYKRLNIAGLKASAPNGILFTFSCSQVIDDVLFYNTVAAAAIETGTDDGMINFNQSLFKLVQEGKVSKEEALGKATNPQALEMNFKGIFLSEGKRILDEIAATMLKLKGRHVEIIGNTDNEGLRASNISRMR